jgi:hypothetical protein
MRIRHVYREERVPLFARVGGRCPTFDREPRDHAFSSEVLLGCIGAPRPSTLPVRAWLPSLPGPSLHQPCHAGSPLARGDAAGASETIRDRREGDPAAREG